MSRIHGKNSRMEVRVRAVLWRHGLRFRIHYGQYKIDVAFPGARLAVFLDSCFWHGCPLHGELPKTRSDFWLRKLSRNKARDVEATRVLASQGWTVLRFFEHELSGDLNRVFARVEEALQGSEDASLLKGSSRER